MPRESGPPRRRRPGLPEPRCLRPRPPTLSRLICPRTCLEKTKPAQKKRSKRSFNPCIVLQSRTACLTLRRGSSRDKHSGKAAAQQQAHDPTLEQLRGTQTAFTRERGRIKVPWRYLPSLNRSSHQIVLAHVVLYLCTPRNSRTGATTACFPCNRANTSAEVEACTLPAC